MCFFGGGEGGRGGGGGGDLVATCDLHDGTAAGGAAGVSGVVFLRGGGGRCCRTWWRRATWARCWCAAGAMRDETGRNYLTRIWNWARCGCAADAGRNAHKGRARAQLRLHSAGRETRVQDGRVHGGSGRMLTAGGEVRQARACCAGVCARVHPLTTPRPTHPTHPPISPYIYIYIYIYNY